MSTFARFIDDLTQVARKALAEPEMGNWFSATFNYGDYYYQYAWYYKDGSLVCEQCNNVTYSPDLNIKSRARKREHFGYMAPTVKLLAKDRPSRDTKPGRWSVIRELLRWLITRRK